MELGLELGSIVGLDDVDSKREPADHFIDKSNRRGLIRRIKHFEDSQARAVVDGRKLIKALPIAWNPLEDFTSSCRRCPGSGFS